MSSSPNLIKRKPVQGSGPTSIKTDCLPIRRSSEGSGVYTSPISSLPSTSPILMEQSPPSSAPASPTLVKVADSRLRSAAERISIHSEPKDEILSVNPDGKGRKLTKEDIESRAGEALIEGETHASGKGKCKAERLSAFHRLPREIIQQVLLVADPNVFDSLTLLNKSWHEASQCPLLYAHQLRKCGVSVPDNPADEHLLFLKRQFNLQSRRALHESIIRPHVTEIHLISSSPSSAGALPGGDKFRFEFSPNGQYLLVLSSSRIFIVYLAGAEVVVKRELKIVKRPVTAAILDDGTTLAVLSSNHVVTVYDLRGGNAHIVKTLPLESGPRSIALSPGAAVLAAAYEGGVEVCSLHPSALVTDRREVNCDAVDSLAFSSDGLVLLGTTLHTKPPITVIISAPFFSADLPEEENLSQMWTTQVLFPRSSRDNSHAALLPEACSDDDGNSWTITYDRTFGTFRAVRVDDLRNGHTYFTGPNDESAISPTTLPAPSPNGGFVAAGFAGNEIWIYGIPERLDWEPDRGVGSGTSVGDRDSTSSQSNTPARAGSDRGSLHGVSGGRNGASGFVPQWRDQLPGVFVSGKQIGEVRGLAGLKFVKSEHRERLVAVASGGVGTFEGGDGEDIAVDGGRVVVFDFTKGPRVAEKTTITVEIGEGQHGPVETLTEEQRDLETEVNLARRRTVAQRTRNQAPLPSLPTLRLAQSDTTGLAPPVNLTRAAPSRATTHLQPDDRVLSTFSPGDEDISTFEEAVDLPYSHSDPRSRSTLTRAATAAATAHQRFGTPRHVGATRVVGPDGRPIRQQQPGPPGGEDDWEPPPPPYTPRSDNDPPLPIHLLLSLQPRAAPLPPVPNVSIDQPPQQIVRAGTSGSVGSVSGGNSLGSSAGSVGGVGGLVRRRLSISQRLNTATPAQNAGTSQYNTSYLHPAPRAGEGTSYSAPTSPATGRGEGVRGVAAFHGGMGYVNARSVGRPSTGVGAGPGGGVLPVNFIRPVVGITHQQQQQQQQQLLHLPPPNAAPANTGPPTIGAWEPRMPSGFVQTQNVGQGQPGQPPMPDLRLYHQYQQTQQPSGNNYLPPAPVQPGYQYQSVVDSSGSGSSRQPQQQQYIPPNVPTPAPLLLPPLPPPPIPTLSSSPSTSPLQRMLGRSHSRGRRRGGQSMQSYNTGMSLSTSNVSAYLSTGIGQRAPPSPSPLRNTRRAASQRSRNGRWGSVRRVPSRAERSAARNVQEARRRRAEREMERGQAGLAVAVQGVGDQMGTRGQKRGEKEKDKGKGCIVM